MELHPAIREHKIQRFECSNREARAIFPVLPVIIRRRNVRSTSECTQCAVNSRIRSQIKRLDILEGLSRPFEFRRERDSQKYTFGAIWSKKIDEDVKGNLISTGEETEGNYARKHTKRNLKIRGGYSFVYGCIGVGIGRN